MLSGLHYSAMIRGVCSQELCLARCAIAVSCDALSLKKVVICEHSTHLQIDRAVQLLDLCGIAPVRVDISPGRTETAA